MAVMECEEGIGNDIERQVLKINAINNVHEAWTLLPLNTTTHLHLYHIIAVDWMVEKEYSLEQDGLLSDDCGTDQTLTALALFCHNGNEYKQLLKQQHSGLQQWQIGIDDIEVLAEWVRMSKRYHQRLVERFTSQY
ncbi:hypothetical protein BDD12DRAFT_875303 [Trichophaea hybrida]|nr:hypothetical protein BDD12DRAFT_875303 [Trichophaea hybrida]